MRIKLKYIGLRSVCAVLLAAIGRSNYVFADSTIKYVALGDSYTIGEGVPESERWPNQLVAILRNNGIRISLEANPAKTGWATRDVLREQIPLLKERGASFVTLLVGVNDIVRGGNEKAFALELTETVNEIQKVLPEKKRLILITIPDYFLTPVGRRFSRGGDSGVKAFNRVIVDVASATGVSTVDINPLSKKVSSDPSLTAADGLHPSGKQYGLWAELIGRTAVELLGDD